MANISTTSRITIPFICITDKGTYTSLESTSCILNFIRCLFVATGWKHRETEFKRRHKLIEWRDVPVV